METEDAEIAKAIAKSELEEHEKGNQRKGGDRGKEIVILYLPPQSIYMYPKPKLQTITPVPPCTALMGAVSL